MKRLLIPSLLSIALVGCSPEQIASITNSVNAANESPTVTVNQNISVTEGNAVSVPAIANDVDGTIASYQWVQLNGPNVTLGNTTTSTISFVAPAVDQDTQLQFKVTVTDDKGASASATVYVTVKDSATSGTNIAPTVSITGPSQSNEGSSVSLVSNASDSDGVISSYSWTQTNGQSVTLGNTSSANLNFTAPQVTANSTVTFQLVVTDNDGATASSTHTLNVLDVPVENVAPTVSISGATAVDLNAVVTLSANANDTDGTIASYLWQQITGTTVTMTGVNSSTLTFTASGLTQAETLVFSVTVLDNDGAATTSTHSVGVNVPVVGTGSLSSTFSLAHNAAVNAGSIETITVNFENGTNGVWQDNFWTEIYLSDDAVLDVSDTFISDEYIFAKDTSAGATYSQAVDIVIPSRGGINGQAYIIVDTWAYSNSAENTTSFAINLNHPLGDVKPDLAITAVNWGFEPGAFFSIADVINPMVTFENLGDIASSEVGFTIAVSTDPFWDDTDEWISDFYINQEILLSGSSDTWSTDWDFGAHLTPGSYYLVAKVDFDDNLAELDETNNTAAIAVNIIDGTPFDPMVDGTLLPANQAITDSAVYDDVDWFRFDVVGTEDRLVTLNINTTNHDASAVRDYVVYFYDENTVDYEMDFLAINFCMQCQDSNYQVVLKPGSYAIAVFNADDVNTETFSYDISWAATTAPVDDNHESDDSRVEANVQPLLTEATTVNGVSWDTDTFELAIPAGVNAIEATLVQPVGSYLSLLLFAENSITGEWDCITCDIYESTAIAAVDNSELNYYLLVMGTNGHQGVNYSISWNSYTLVDDIYEPNDSAANAYPIAAGVTYSGVQWDDDWYQITVPAGQEQVAISLSFLHSEGDIDLTLYDANINELTSSASVSDNEFISYEVPVAGTYYVLVEFADTGSSYDLSWTSSAPVAARNSLRRGGAVEEPQVTEKNKSLFLH